MKITYDSEANAALIRLVDAVEWGEVTRDIHSIRTPTGDGKVSLGFDKDGRLLEVEILNADRVLRKETLDLAVPPTITEEMEAKLYEGESPDRY